MSAESKSNHPDLSDLRPTVIDFSGKGAGPDSVAAQSNRPSISNPLRAADQQSPWQRWEVYGCFLLMAVAVQLALGPKIQLSQWELSANSNAAVAEAVAWSKGRLDLPPVRNHELLWDVPTDGIDATIASNRLHDTAFNPSDGKIYNVFPPLFTILTYVLTPVQQNLFGMPEGMWRPGFMALLIYWPLLIATFVVFYRRLGHPLWAAAIGFAFIGGSAILPNLRDSGQGFLGQMDHVASQVGLLIVAADLLGKRRIWPALIGLAIATYARQMTFLYAIILLVFAYHQYQLKGAALCGLGLAAIASPLLALNQLKFGNPLEFGYRHIYVGREDDFMGARCIEHGTFSWKYVFGVDGDHGNLYYMHAAPPSVGEISLVNVDVKDNNQCGTSLWITTPLALWVLIAAACWWREPSARALMLGTIPVMIGLALYHSPSYIAHGYNRFVLDFLPIWLVVVAPYAIGGRQRWRSWLTAAFAAWGLLYFYLVVPAARSNVATARQVAMESVTHGEV